MIEKSLSKFTKSQRKCPTQQNKKGIWYIAAIYKDKESWGDIRNCTPQIEKSKRNTYFLIDAT